MIGHRSFQHFTQQGVSLSIRSMQKSQQLKQNHIFYSSLIIPNFYHNIQRQSSSFGTATSSLSKSKKLLTSSNSYSTSHFIHKGQRHTILLANPSFSCHRLPSFSNNYQHQRPPFASPSFSHAFSTLSSLYSHASTDDSSPTISSNKISQRFYGTIPTRGRGFATTRARKSKFSWSDKSPYELLNITRSATDKEVKVAYFKEAKKCHPDLNPNDPEAKEKFQAVAAAYELLSDPKRRAQYDATGYTGQQAYNNTSSSSEGSQHYYGQQANYGGYSQQHAEDIFRSVSADVDVIKEALLLLKEEWRDEFNLLLDAAHRRDWHQVWEIAKDHRLLISSIVIPTILFLRYPPAVFAVLRMMMAGLNVGVAFLVYTGNLEVAARLIWRQIVTLSTEQKEKAEERRNRKK